MQRGYNETVIDGYSGFIFTNREGYVHNPQTINRAIKRIYTAYNEQEKGQGRSAGSLSLSGIFPSLTSGILFVPGSVKTKPI